MNKYIVQYNGNNQTEVKACCYHFEENDFVHFYDALESRVASFNKHTVGMIKHIEDKSGEFNFQFETRD